MALVYVMFAVGMTFSLALVIRNSMHSQANGLSEDWNGVMSWLSHNLFVTIFRVVIGFVLAPALLSDYMVKVGATLQAAGFHLPAWGLAFFVGLSEDQFFYQVTGLFAKLRTDMPLAVPPTEPPKSQPQPPATG